MTKNVVYVRETMRALPVAAYFRQHGVDEAPVVDELGHPVGMVALSDLEAALVEAALPSGAGDVPPRVGPTMRDLMMPISATLPMSAPVLAAAAMMDEHKIHQLFVVTPDGELAGVFSAFDLARWVLEDTGHNEPDADEDEGQRPLLAARVEEVMHDCEPVDPSESLARVRTRFVTNELPYLPVAGEDERAVGLLARVDVDAMAEQYPEGTGGLEYLEVEDVMRSPFLTIREGASAGEAWELFHGGESVCLIVVDEGLRPLGILLPRDLEPAPRPTPTLGKRTTVTSLA